MVENRLLCPACNSSRLVVKYEAKYVYSYVLDGDAPGIKNTVEFLPFMYDSREQTEARQYIECCVCNAQYPCFFTDNDKSLDFKVLHQALHSGQCSGIDAGNNKQANS